MENSCTYGKQLHKQASNVDSIVIITILLLLVLCLFYDWTHEGVIIAIMICQIVVFTFSRAAIAWWANNHEVGNTRLASLLAWRNVGIVFHFSQLLVALSPWAESIAPLALKRLRDSTIVFPMTCLMVGFLCGVEPGTHKAKARGASVIVALIAMRLLVLARALGAANSSRSSRSGTSSPLVPSASALYSYSGENAADQRELLAGGFRTLLCAPLLGAAIGMAVRTKLEQQSSEISRLQEHASNLEAARHEALMNRRRLPGSSHHPAPRNASDANPPPPPPPPQHLPPQRNGCGGAGCNVGAGCSRVRGASSVSSYGSTLAELEAYESGPESEDPHPPPPPLPSEAFLRVPSPPRQAVSRAERDAVLWRTLQESGLELTEESTGDGGMDCSSVHGGVNAGARADVVCVRRRVVAPARAFDRSGP